MTTWVIAGNHAEFMDWVRANGSAAAEVINVWSLTGALFDPADDLEFVGTWWRRADLREVIYAAWRSVLKSRRRPVRIYEALEPFVHDWTGANMAEVSG